VPDRPNIAVVGVGDPASPATWSGVTAGILAGLGDLDVAVHTIDLALPKGLEQLLLAVAAAPTLNRFDAEGAALTSRSRSLSAGRRLRGNAIDGVIQIGTTFSLPPGPRYVTLEDMTLRQGSSVHPVFSRMSPRAIASWERRRSAIYAGARMCTAASRWTAASLRHDYGLAPGRVAVVGFGANHRMRPSERDWSVPRYLFVGIDWQRKGGPEVLRAFARVRERHPAATLDLIGGHPPLEQEGVSAHGVLSHARERDREIVAGLFARATCFVMPSLVEPFGIAYVEAGSAGVPSIGTSVGGPRDVIGSDGGIVVEPGDEAGLLEAMLRLANPETSRRMGEVARGRSALYTWTKVAERLLRSLGADAPDGRVLADFL
jgi:glycosyltransferase involved in cell wall biosynthesis